MNEDENKNKRDNVLNILVSDEIVLSEDVTVAPSDITVIARDKDNEEHNIVFPQAVSSEAIVQSLSDELCIPSDNTAIFQEIVTEYIEFIKKGPTEAKMEVSLPLHKLCHRLHNLKLISIDVKIGQKTTIKKYTTKRLQPKEQEKPKDEQKQ